MKILNLEITRWGHDAFRIAGSKLIYTDPYKIPRQEAADIVLLSHEHFDHLSLEDLKKVCTADTTIVASPLCADAIQSLGVKEKHFLGPNAAAQIAQVKVETLPAYNVNKFREPGKPFHPKDEKRLGFVIHMDGTSVYYAGDTDFIPEMKHIQCDIALLPVSGTYVMTAEEAAEAAAAIRPKIAVPMHYGAIVGSADDAQKFRSLVKNCQVEIL